MSNIHPIYASSVQANEKEDLLNQKSIVIWMVGLSGSGKSTLAKSLEKELHNRGFLTMLLDGDNLRTGINNNLGFSEEDRAENIRRAAETAKLFAQCGIITICSFISPTDAIRSKAKEIIGEKYYEVYINCPIEVCEKRDVKGLYQKARAGQLKGFTGIDSPFDAPKNPNLDLRTDIETLEKCSDYLLEAVIELIKK